MRWAAAVLLALAATANQAAPGAALDAAPVTNPSDQSLARQLSKASATADSLDHGRQLYGAKCARCHGPNMVNPGTITFDLRRFPADDPERFVVSVLHGKGNMPSWRSALSDDELSSLWVYVSRRGALQRP